MINPAMPVSVISRRRTSSILALAGRLLVARLAEGLRPLGLAPAQFVVLTELWNEEVLTQRALADRKSVV